MSAQCEMNTELTLDDLASQLEADGYKLSFRDDSWRLYEKLIHGNDTRPIAHALLKKLQGRRLTLGDGQLKTSLLGSFSRFVLFCDEGYAEVTVKNGQIEDQAMRMLTPHSELQGTRLCLVEICLSWTKGNNHGSN